ncbi:MAG: signal recognition particle-docking protein FtsY [Pseudomonadota bacterium]
MSSSDGVDEKKPKGNLLGRLFGGQKRAVEKDQQSAHREADENQRSETASTDEADAPVAVGETAQETAGLESTQLAEGPDENEGPDQKEEPPQKAGWFSRLREGLSRTSSRLSDGIGGLFTKAKLDPETLEDFEDLLIQADLGVATATRITETLSSAKFDKGLSADQVRTVLVDEVQRVLEPVTKPLQVEQNNRPHVILMVGVNGSGKTTTIGKLAAQFVAQGRAVMLAAGDTFRAAAIDQLKVWGTRTGCEVIARDVGSDASGLAFDAMERARQSDVDVLLIDTAGRLQNKTLLMDELEKVIRVIKKSDPDAPHDVVLVLDATTGQNALQQVAVFQQKAEVTGLIMTKLDGTARGGILVAISEKFGLPVHAIGVGEGVDDLQAFAPQEFAKAIAGS